MPSATVAPAYSAQAAKDVAAELGVIVAEGPSDVEAQQRLAREGPNELSRRPLSGLAQGGDHFQDPLVYLLIAAVVVPSHFSGG